MHTVSMEVKGRGDQRLIQGEETRTALIAAARELFGEQGYAATTLDDIAARTGLTKGAVYHHFGGKRELFQAVFEQVQREVSDRVVTVFLEPDHWWALTEGCQLMIDAQLDPAVQRIALHDARSVLGWDTVRSIENRYGAVGIRGALRKAMQGGVIQPQPASTLPMPLTRWPPVRRCASSSCGSWKDCASPPPPDLSISSTGRVVQVIRPT
jgi:AcrR family transcriptional regulator